MAAVGDVLVKFVADFAEFATGLKAGQKELVEFGKQATETGNAIQGFIAAAKAVFATAIVTEAVAAVKKFTEETIKNAIEIEKLAAKYKLTTDQVQGLQAQAKATGEDFNKLAEYYKNHGDQLGKITDAAKTTAQVMQNDLVKAIGNFADAADDAFIKAKWLFQSGGSGAATAINAAAGAVKNLGDSLAYIDTKQAAMAFVIAIATGQWGQVLGGIIGAATNTAGAATTAAADKQLAEANANLERTRELVAQGTLVAKDLQKAEQDVVVAADNLKNARDKARLVQEQDAKLQEAKKTLQNDPITVTPKGGGGGGRTDDEGIQAQINRFNALGEAAKRVAATISANRDKTIEDLQREVRVTQQVEEIAAKLGAKYDQADASKKAELRTSIELYERQKEAYQRNLDYLSKAEALEARLGDGTKARQLAQQNLDRATQAAGDKLSPEARARAQKELNESVEQGRLAATRYDDSLTSLASGFESAANASARAHDMFSLGGDAFNALTGAMGEGIDALVGKSNKGFGEIAADFLLMIAKMTAAAAVSQVFQYLLKAAGLFAGGVTASSGPAGGYNAGIGADGTGWLSPRAGGGPVYGGTPYLVGERGPELFVPSAAGNIVPNSQMGGGGGVTVNIDMNQTQGAANPSAALDFGRKVRAAVVAVIANEKRPGGSLHPATA